MCSRVGILSFFPAINLFFISVVESVAVMLLPDVKFLSHFGFETSFFLSLSFLLFIEDLSTLFVGFIPDFFALFQIPLVFSGKSSCNIDDSIVECVGFHFKPT